MVQNLRRVQEELVKSEKLVSLGRLAAGVAHEIRNPLNAIRVSIGMLQRKIKDQPQAMEFADVVSEEVYKLERFVSDFLNYAKQPPPKHTLTDINELMREMTHSYERLAKERGIIIQENFEPNLPLLPLDPFQMERAINNIMDNAFEAIREGGRLSVSTRLISTKEKVDTEESIEIRIKDNGKGMTADELRNALDPFFTTKELGTGLGLPLTQNIVESHKGQFKIFSKPNKWTTVIMTLRTKLPDASGDIKYESL
jgi:signal transduction histidine kinase